MLDDKLLVWKFNRGSINALSGIYKKYRDDLLRLAVTLLNDIGDAEDIVQNVFIGFAQSAGRRITKTADSTTTKYYYDGDQVIAEYEGTTLVRKFIYGPGIDEPIMMIDVEDENAKYYYHYDALGSVVALSNSSGNIVETYSYDVFGEPSSIGSVGNPYFFTGRRFDTETELYYYRFRYYKPDIGRFLQTDPIGYYGGLNLYTYVRNNPVNLVDPYGLLGIAIGGSGTGGIFPVGITGGGQIVIDHKGNIRLFGHGGGGGYYGGSGLVMADLSLFGGTVSDLPGSFTSYGGSGGALGGFGIEANITDHWLMEGWPFIDVRGSAVTVSFGGFAGLPVEVHGFREGGGTFDIISFVKDILKRAFGDDGVKKVSGPGVDFGYGFHTADPDDRFDWD